MKGVRLCAFALVLIVQAGVGSASLPPTRSGARRASAWSEGRYVSAAEIAARQEWERERGIIYPKLVRGNPNLKEIALTFDDGPHPAFTPRLLDLLARLHVKATFFLVGKMVDRYPDLVRQEVAQGHEVANHTYDHLRLASVPPALIEPELKEGSLALVRAVGSPTRFYRPPGGEYNADVIEAGRRLGYIMVLWTNDPGDYRRPSGALLEERLLRDVSNGAIILLHDGIPQTLTILPRLVTALRREGYRFVTISEMAAAGGVVTAGGPRVRMPSMKVESGFVDITGNRPSPEVLSTMKALEGRSITAKRRPTAD
ncbi:MAG: polysaccharide deacetylase family protein [Chthonomonadales bacterium]